MKIKEEPDGSENENGKVEKIESELKRKVVEKAECENEKHDGKKNRHRNTKEPDGTENANGRVDKGECENENRGRKDSNKKEKKNQMGMKMRMGEMRRARIVDKRREEGKYKIAAQTPLLAS